MENIQQLYFEYENIKFEVLPSNLRWGDDSFKTYIQSKKFDFIINCIGSIPQRTKNFEVNYELPIWLDKHTSSKIIHPGTDCEMDDDEYGISKRNARDFIVNPIRQKL